MKTDLTPKTIFVKNRLLVLILLALLSVTFIPFGILLLMSFFTTREIIMLIIGLALILASIIAVGVHLKTDIKILQGKYEIHEDLLKDKNRHTTNYNDGNRSRTYHLYFEKQFKADNKPILCARKDYFESKIGDKFYIIYCDKLRYAFNESSYTLSDTSKIEQTVKRSNSAKNTVSNTDKKELTIQIIKNDFLIKGKHLKTILMLLVCAIAISAGFIGIVKSNQDIIPKIALGLMSIFLLFFLITKIFYVSKIFSNLNKNKFTISTEKITKIGDTAYRNSNNILKLKFEKYNKYVIVHKPDFPDIKEGDSCHLVFVESESIPIRVYDTRNWTK